MVPARHTAAGLTPAADDGVNLLWKFQLRKENAGILEKLQASERAIQECASESTRYFQEINERVAALEEKLAKTDSEAKKDRQAIESWGVAVKALRAKIDARVEERGSASKCSK